MPANPVLEQTWLKIAFQNGLSEICLLGSFLVPFSKLTPGEPRTAKIIKKETRYWCLFFHALLHVLLLLLLLLLLLHLLLLLLLLLLLVLLSSVSPSPAASAMQACLCFCICSYSCCCFSCSLLLCFSFCLCFSRQKQQQVEFTTKVIATTFQLVLASEPSSRRGLQWFPPWTLPAEASASASPSVSASASIPKHLLLFLYLLSRHKQQQVEFTAEIIAVIAQSLRASGHVPETWLQLFLPWTLPHKAWEGEDAHAIPADCLGVRRWPTAGVFDNA